MKLKKGKERKKKRRSKEKKKTSRCFILWHKLSPGLIDSQLPEELGN